MDITVTFNNGRWTTDPNPAIVAVGTKIRWILRAPELVERKLVWKVSFQARPPFGEEHMVLKTFTEPVGWRQRSDLNMDALQKLNLGEDAAVTHRGVTESHSANRPGDFKYDLSVEDAATGERIGEDDPWLIVVRGVIRPFDLYVF